MKLRGLWKILTVGFCFVFFSVIFVEVLRFTLRDVSSVSFLMFCCCETRMEFTSRCLFSCDLVSVDSFDNGIF